MQHSAAQRSTAPLSTTPLSSAQRLFLALVVLIPAIALWLHGPIAQPEGYHDFADRRLWLGLPNAADVLSNLPFLLAGALGLYGLRHAGHAARLFRGFFIAVLLTTAGSFWYHLAPDDARLVLDRLPIAFACVLLLLAHVEPTLGPRSRLLLWPALILAAASVWLWYAGQRAGADAGFETGQGDLRLYLYLQFLPMLLMPAVLLADARRRREWPWLVLILGLYAVAKVLELNDSSVLGALGVISGHTIKHLLAAIAAAAVLPLARLALHPCAK